MRAFTLIEVLCVVALLGLMSVLAIASLGSVTDAAARERAVAACRATDARARLHARTTGAMILTSSADRTVLRVHRTGDGEMMAETALPRGVTAHIVATPGGEAVRFDGHGRSPDYEIRMTIPGGRIRCAVSGLSGHVTEDAP